MEKVNVNEMLGQNTFRAAVHHLESQQHQMTMFALLLYSQMHKHIPNRHLLIRIRVSVECAQKCGGITLAIKTVLIK